MSNPAPTRPARPFGRSLADFHDYIHMDGQPLYPAERKLLEASGHLRKVVEIDFVAVWPSYGFGFSVFVIESGVIY